VNVFFEEGLVIESGLVAFNHTQQSIPFSIFCRIWEARMNG
jgi:hypothetical protein